MRLDIMRSLDRLQLKYGTEAQRNSLLSLCGVMFIQATPRAAELVKACPALESIQSEGVASIA